MSATISSIFGIAFYEKFALADELGYLIAMRTDKQEWHASVCNKKIVCACR